MSGRVEVVHNLLQPWPDVRANGLRAVLAGTWHVWCQPPLGEAGALCQTTRQFHLRPSMRCTPSWPAWRRPTSCSTRSPARSRPAQSGGPRSRRWAGQGAGRVAPGRGDHRVDLCCGRGGIGLWFASASGARLTGVDFSPGAIAQARLRGPSCSCPAPLVSSAEADAADTSLPCNHGRRAGMHRRVAVGPRRQRAAARDGPGAASMCAGGDHHLGAEHRRTGRSAIIVSVIIDAGALAEGPAGLHLLVREERSDWLKQQQVFYQQAAAAERYRRARASPARRRRRRCSHLAFARRLLLVASA